MGFALERVASTNRGQHVVVGPLRWPPPRPVHGRRFSPNPSAGQFALRLPQPSCSNAAARIGPALTEPTACPTHLFRATRLKLSAGMSDCLLAKGLVQNGVFLGNTTEDLRPHSAGE
jgi:hypothetical protein